MVSVTGAGLCAIATDVEELAAAVGGTPSAPCLEQAATAAKAAAVHASRSRAAVVWDCVCFISLSVCAPQSSAINSTGDFRACASSSPADGVCSTGLARRTSLSKAVKNRLQDLRTRVYEAKPPTLGSQQPLQLILVRD